MAKKTIFNIVQSNVRGGLENVYLQYSQILASDFEVICLVSKDFPHIAALKKLGLKIEIINISGHFDIISTIKFGLLVKKYRPQLVMAHNGRSFSIINLYKFFFLKKNFKTIAITHGGNPKRLVNFDYIIAVAHHLAKNIKQKYRHISEKNIFVIHNGIEINRNYSPKNKEQNHSFTCGTLSRLSPEKNIITALESFKKFCKKVSNAKFLVAGQGPELKNLEKFVKINKLENNVKFLGHVSNIANFFDKIDILIHPAFSEPFGLVILEAFNHHTPVIAPNCAGPSEIINNNHDGYLYNNANSSKNLFETLDNYYFKEIKNKEQITKNAYDNLEKNFSLDVTRDRLLGVINSL